MAKFITPSATSLSVDGFVVFLPDDVFAVAAFLAAFLELTKPENWQEVDGLTPDEIAELFQGCYELMLPLTKA